MELFYFIFFLTASARVRILKTRKSIEQILYWFVSRTTIIYSRDLYIYLRVYTCSSKINVQHIIRLLYSCEYQ